MARAVCVTLDLRVSAEEAIKLRDDWKAAEKGGPEPVFKCPLCLPRAAAARVGPRHGRHPESDHPGAPHFARFPREEHAPGCKLGVERIIKELQEQGEGALQRERFGGQIRFRVAMPSTFVKPPPSSTLTAVNRSDNDQVYVERCKPLLNTAVRVTQMMADLRREGASLREEFRAICDGVDVGWLSFIYTPRRLHTLALRLENNPELTHPVAAVFLPTSAGMRGYGNARHWIRSSVRPPGGEPVKRRGLFVRAPYKDWLPTVSDEQGYVAYGMWTLGDESNEKFDKPLALELTDRRSIAALPAGITCRTLDVWAAGDNLWQN